MRLLSRSIARNCAKDNTLVDGVAPDSVLTDLAEEDGTEPGLDKTAAIYTTGRVATPEEVRGGIGLLAGEIAPQTTGSTIDLPGGTEVR